MLTLFLEATVLEVTRQSYESEFSSLSFLFPLLRGYLVFAVCLLLLSCNTPQGSYHKLRKMGASALELLHLQTHHQN